MTLREWFARFGTGKPHFYIGGEDNPYMLRWFLIPRNNWLNVYLHKFLRDDDDRAMHDHPWWFASLILWGAYFEYLPGGLINIRTMGCLAFRRATHQHIVKLPNSSGGKVPCWTLVITGPRGRTWGFWCPKGFVPWTEFVAQDSHGNTGKGCA